MLRDVEVQGVGPGAVAHAAATLRQEFPGLSVRGRRPAAAPVERGVGRRSATVIVPSRVWWGHGFDPRALDEAATAAEWETGGFSLAIVDDGEGDLALTALQVVTRCQHHFDGRNRHSSGPPFDDVLALHRSLHDLSKPLVAADFDHARDTWRWVLRLEPDASLAVQIAALFHDVERLVSEADERVEQHAADYPAFKGAHAAAGAEMARAVLGRTRAAPALVARVAELVATHERRQGDPERILLAEADALSFFSLNACGFLSYYGAAHTKKKVAYTLDRLGPRGRSELTRIRHRADLAHLMMRALGDRGTGLAWAGVSP